jgi:hypothetical protein
MAVLPAQGARCLRSLALLAGLRREYHHDSQNGSVTSPLDQWECSSWPFGTGTAVSSPARMGAYSARSSQSGRSFEVRRCDFGRLGYRLDPAHLGPDDCYGRVERVLTLAVALKVGPWQPVGRRFSAGAASHGAIALSPPSSTVGMKR